MTTLQNTTGEVLRLASEHFRVPLEKLTRTTISSRRWESIACKLSISLTRIEQHFHIELPDYELQGVSDFRTLAERIQSRL